MSVLVEAITVVFRNSSIERNVQGGIETVQKNPPNSTYRTDGLLSAVSFMDPEATEQFVKSLSDVRLVFMENGTAKDIAVLDQHRGITSPCDWIEFYKNDDGVSGCYLIGHPVGDFAVYDNWNSENNLIFNDDDAADTLRFIREENGLDVYLNIETGKDVFRPHSDVNLIQKSRNQLAFTTMVKRSYDLLLADGWQSLIVKTNADNLFHLAMRLRNQLCIVFVEVEWIGALLSPFTDKRKEAFRVHANAIKAIPLFASFRVSGLLPDNVNSVADAIQSNCFEMESINNYVFEDLNTGFEWTPENCNFDEDIELSRWEVHDFGIQIVRQSLEQDGHEIEGYDSDLDASPHIVAIIDGKRTNIIVDTACYPKRTISFDQDLCKSVLEFSAQHGCDFKTAAVHIASPDDPFDPAYPLAIPIYRGQQARARFDGLEDPQFNHDG